MQQVLEKIKSRGYWKIIIRPSEFIKDRISEPRDCAMIVRDNAIRLRGWDYPHYDMIEKTETGLDHVEQSIDWQDHIEAWRFYQSGLFIHYVALWEDWFELNPWGKARMIPPRECLSIISAMYFITEIYEFAARLGAKSILGDSCNIKITLCNTENRKLVTLDPRRHLFAEYRTTLNEIPHDVSLETANLKVRSAELSLEHSVWLFQRFNWHDVQPEIFIEEQRTLLDKRS